MVLIRENRYQAKVNANIAPVIIAGIFNVFIIVVMPSKPWLLNIAAWSF